MEVAVDCIVPWSAFIDRAPYPPTAWAKDTARLRVTSIPERIGFAIQSLLAVRMIERTIGTGMPFSRAAADTEYGVGDVE